MSVRYRNNAGTETIVSGLTPGGDIEAGAVATRQGTVTTESDIATGQNLQPQITFDTPLPDTDYDITLEAVSNWPADSGAVTVVPFHSTKTVNGFKIIIYNTTGNTIPAGMVVYWKATKTYTVQHDIQNTEAIASIQSAIPSGAGSGNQLTTKSYVDNADANLNDRISDLEDLVPAAASVTNQLITKAEVSVDSALSASSEHAVQNKVVKAALDGKQDTLQYDNLPTENSEKMVKSKGIYNAIKTERDARNILNTKNIFNLQSANETKQGLTFTNNLDGSFTVSGGTASTDTFYYLGKLTPPSGAYTLSKGALPGVMYFDGYMGDTWIKTLLPIAGVGISETTVEIDYNGYDNVRILFAAVNGESYTTAVTYYPMIRVACDTDNTWQSYAMTNQEITDKFSYQNAFIDLFTSATTSISTAGEVPFGNGTTDAFPEVFELDETTHRIKVKLPGLYMVEASVHGWYNINGGVRWWINKDGASINNVQSQIKECMYHGNTSAAQFQDSSSTIIYVNAPTEFSIGMQPMGDGGGIYDNNGTHNTRLYIRRIIGV